MNSPRDTSESGDQSIDELQEDIAHTRDQLADTVDALTARLDVKSRVRHGIETGKEDARAQVQAVRDRITDEDGKPRRSVIGGAVAAGALGVLTALAIRKSRA